MIMKAELKESFEENCKQLKKQPFLSILEVSQSINLNRKKNRAQADDERINWINLRMFRLKDQCSRSHNQRWDCEKSWIIHSLKH